MRFQLLSYPNSNKTKPSFYIQIKGNNSGRPLKNPIPNCVAVYTDVPYLFEVVFLLFKGRAFEPCIIGSVVPFVRLDDIKKIVSKGLESYSPQKEIYLSNIRKVEQAIDNYSEQIRVLKQLQVACCHKFLK